MNMQNNSVQTYCCNDTRISDLQFVNKYSAFLKKNYLTEKDIQHMTQTQKKKHNKTIQQIPTQ